MDLEVSRLGIFTPFATSCNFVSVSLLWFDDGSKSIIAFLSLHLHEKNVNVVLFVSFYNYVVSLDVDDFEVHFAIDGYGNHVLCPHLNIVIIIDYYVVFDIYLWRKVVCFVLFCFVVMRSTEQRCFKSCSWCLWKAFDEKGCMGLDPWHLDLRSKSSWILNDFFSEN